MSEARDVRDRLETACSDADVLAAFAEASGGAAPSLAQLEKWYAESCLSSVKKEVDARLRALRPHGLRDPELFAKQRCLGLESSVGDGSPLAVTRLILRAWQPDKPLLNPWAILVKSWQEHCPPSKAFLLVTQEPKTPSGKRALELSRAAAVLHLATVSVVEVDGVPFASEAPGPRTPKRLYRVASMTEQPHLSRVLLPHPRTLQGRATAGVLVEALAHLDLTDERSSLRADMLRLGEIAYALTKTVHFSEAEGAVMLGNRNTPALRKRLNRALWGLRVLRVQVGDVFYALADAEPGPVNALGPPRWWTQGMRRREQQIRELKGRRKRLPPSEQPLAHRLSGGLFRSRSFGRDGRRGPEVGGSGRLGQTIAGIEAALTWAATHGRGADARVPEYMLPVQKGKHGNPVFLHAWQVLRVSGENVGPESMDGNAMARFRRRAAALESAGYFLDGRAVAPAGDTIEIVERWRGSRTRRAGLVVRASARFCEAYTKGTRTRIPADRLLKP